LSKFSVCNLYFGLNAVVYFLITPLIGGYNDIGLKYIDLKVISQANNY